MVYEALTRVMGCEYTQAEAMALHTVRRELHDKWRAVKDEVDPARAPAGDSDGPQSLKELLI